MAIWPVGAKQVTKLDIQQFSIFAEIILEVTLAAPVLTQDSLEISHQALLESSHQVPKIISLEWQGLVLLEDFLVGQ